MQIPNCVPEYYRCLEEDAARNQELKERKRKFYEANKVKVDIAKEDDLPILCYGGFPECQDCDNADHNTAVCEEDDFCNVICHNLNCIKHKEEKNEL